MSKLLGLTEEARTTTSTHLQQSLVQMIDLALICKQIHWNVRGPQFRAVHLQLDEIVVDLRAHSDDLAERIATLDVPADGRARTVASTSTVPALEAGFLPALDAARDLSARFEHAVETLRRAQAELADLDPISEDMVIGITSNLEQHQWMLRSLTSDDPRAADKSVQRVTGKQSERAAGAMSGATAEPAGATAS
ncbi:Dps family protein [Engelhardtia mirabilis]|uniref:Fine tangled pili major subunit n=1 Tax=Engelhardtia mirabilis TaxID=2528011 RepID=A0A518BSW2_9BACT|nr:Fine tangled pili major subunit [Planctomycetes bacterium Pla133]QDV04383.1 Fine tangled pili major subunit [Planctomycetes bacterium Pla86]